MIEIQCTSCQTRYRIDERILPDDTPTFKCSRCGHVFSAEPRGRAPRRPNAGAGPSAQSQAESKAGTNKAPQDLSAEVPDAASAAAAKTPPGASGGAAANDPRPRPSAEVASSPGPRSAPAATPRRAESQQPRSPAEAAPLAGESGPQDQRPPAPARTAESEARRPVSPLSPPSPASSSAASAGDAGINSKADVASRPAASERPSGEQRPSRRPPIEVSEEAEDPDDNLSFDFSDEARETFSGLEPAKEDAAEKWEVGEAPQPPLPPPPPRAAARKRPRFTASDIDNTPDENGEFQPLNHEEASAAAARLEAEFHGRSSRVRSAGFFLGVFALFVFGFGLASLVICGAPIASAQLLGTLPMIGPSLQPPVSPAQRVALTNVQSRYATIKDNENALIISGTAENVSTATLNAVRIGAALIGPGQRLLRAEAVYCGNNLSPTMISEMTPPELEFFEKLGGPKTFSLAPQASAPFVIVFVAPPTEASRFQLRVDRAELAGTGSPLSIGS